MKKWGIVFRSAAICFLAAVLFLSSVRASDSSDVIRTALGEVGYTETAAEYTKYGQWYGLPNSFWCDMFVSWCASQAGVPAAQFPRQCGCIAHVNLFSRMGRYQKSAARGGSYIPLQGDVIFFYNYVSDPGGTVPSHVGLVLCVADGYVYTIEGNALANRLDYPSKDVAERIDDDLDPLDRVVVNRYPLGEPRIHGYGIPAYDSRTPLELDGFVDVDHGPSQAVDSEMFRILCDNGVMSGTTAHTFSPSHGMTKGEFLQLVVNFFGIPAAGAETPPFSDLPADSPYYAAVMSARAAGLVNGTELNLFLPDIYIASSEAQAIFDRALEYFDWKEQFTFSSGARSYLLTPYTIRADIARAFYTLFLKLPVSEPNNEPVFLNGMDCSVRNLRGVSYVPLSSLQLLSPALDVVGEIYYPDSVWNTDRVLPAYITLRMENQFTSVLGFVHQGTAYVELKAAASFLRLDVEYTVAETDRTPLKPRP